MSGLNLDREKPIKMQIYEWLKGEIVSGRLVPGARLDKNMLAKELEVSLTPLREALILLKHDGFIDMIPSLHTAVKLIDPKMVLENAFIRSSLEGSVVEHLAITGLSESTEDRCRRLIARQWQAFEAEDYGEVFQCDLRIHKSLCDTLQLNTLWQNLHSNRSHLDRARQCSPINVPGIRKAIEQHEMLLDLITQAKPREARELIKDHVYSVFKDLEKIDRKYLFEEIGDVVPA